MEHTSKSSLCVGLLKLCKNVNSSALHAIKNRKIIHAGIMNDLRFSGENANFLEILLNIILSFGANVNQIISLIVDEFQAKVLYKFQ